VRGGTRSRAWLRVFADVLGVPLELARTPEVGARGAVLVAAGALGVELDTAAWIAPDAVVEPDPARRELYEDGYRRYLAHLAAAAPCGRAGERRDDPPGPARPGRRPAWPGRAVPPAGRPGGRPGVLGEGNTSAALGDGTFLVKASGTMLGGVTEDDLVLLDHAAVLELIDDTTLDDHDQPGLAARLRAAGRTSDPAGGRTSDPAGGRTSDRPGVPRPGFRGCFQTEAGVHRDDAARTRSGAARGAGGRAHPPDGGQRAALLDRAAELVAGCLFPDQVGGVRGARAAGALRRAGVAAGQGGASGLGGVPGRARVHAPADPPGQPRDRALGRTPPRCSRYHDGGQGSPRAVRRAGDRGRPGTSRRTPCAASTTGRTSSTAAACWPAPSASGPTGDPVTTSDQGDPLSVPDQGDPVPVPDQGDPVTGPASPMTPHAR